MKRIFWPIAALSLLLACPLVSLGSHPTVASWMPDSYIVKTDLRITPGFRNERPLWRSFAGLSAPIFLSSSLVFMPRAEFQSLNWKESDSETRYEGSLIPIYFFSDTTALAAQVGAGRRTVAHTDYEENYFKLVAYSFHKMSGPWSWGMGFFSEIGEDSSLFVPILGWKWKSGTWSANSWLPQQVTVRWSPEGSPWSAFARISGNTSLGMTADPMEKTFVLDAVIGLRAVTEHLWGLRWDIAVGAVNAGDVGESSVLPSVQMTVSR